MNISNHGRKKTMLLLVILWKASAKNETLIAAIQADITENNQNFGKWEQIKKFELTQISGVLLTVTLPLL